MVQLAAAGWLAAAGAVAVWPGRGEGGEEVTSSEQLAEMQSQLQQALDQQAQLSSQQVREDRQMEREDSSYRDRQGS